MNPNPMQTLLDLFILEAPEESKNSFSGQVHFKDGKAVAGQIAKGPTPDTYQILTVGQQGPGKSAVMLGIYFTADSILHVDVMAGEPSKLITPPPTNGRIITAG